MSAYHQNRAGDAALAYRLLPAICLLAACGNKIDVEVTVDIDPEVLRSDEVVSLKVVLAQGGDSGTAVFDNKDEPLDFPVTLSTRVDEARLGDLHIGVSGFDAEGRAILGGSFVATLTGINLSVLVTMDSADPCAAGDGVDEGCCSDFLDNDGNGLGDCQDPSCRDQFEDLCKGAVCGDRDVNPFAGESCDDGNTDSGDGCDSTCLAETDELFSIMEYSEVSDLDSGNDVSVMTNFGYQGNSGFTVVQGGGAGDDCKKVDILAGLRGDANFFFVEYGAFNAVRAGNNTVANTILVDQVEDPTSVGITQAFADAEGLRLELSGGNNLNPQTGGEALFSGPFPTNFDLPAAEAVRTISRNEDTLIEWTPTGVNENVVVILFYGSISSQIFCEAPDAQGSLVIPAEFTRAMPRGLFNDGGGYFMYVAHGRSLEIPLVAADSPDGLVGTLFLNLVHGTQVTGDIL